MGKVNKIVWIFGIKSESSRDRPILLGRTKVTFPSIPSRQFIDISIGWLRVHSKKITKNRPVYYWARLNRRKIKNINVYSLPSPSLSLFFFSLIPPFLQKWTKLYSSMKMIKCRSDTLRQTRTNPFTIAPSEWPL